MSDLGVVLSLGANTNNWEGGGLEMCIHLYSDVTEQARHGTPPSQVSILYYSTSYYGP